jgi:Fic-DOC domain mobile mystery protein B
MEIVYTDGATPLDPDEMAGLRARSITTRAELDSLEQGNILEAVNWIETGRIGDMLSEEFVRKLHLKMFGKVWKWAGTYRHSDKSIGIDWRYITTEIAKLLGDARYHVDERPMPDDEIGARFHYRLEKIHPFPNGNGRHGRLMTDLLMERELGTERFSWGGTNLSRENGVRGRYLEALRTVDRSGDYGDLIEFVRS